MAKSETAEQLAARIAIERERVVCRYCGGKPVHFPAVDSGRPQTDAVCEDCSKHAPWVSVADSVSRLAHPEEPKGVDIRVNGVKYRPGRDYSKENFT